MCRLICSIVSTFFASQSKNFSRQKVLMMVQKKSPLCKKMKFFLKHSPDVEDLRVDIRVQNVCSSRECMTNKK